MTTAQIVTTLARAAVALGVLAAVAGSPYVGERGNKNVREHALEGDDRVVELAAVERGNTEEVVVLRIARKILRRHELDVGLLRIVLAEELASAFNDLRVRCRDSRGVDQSGNERHGTDSAYHYHGNQPFLLVPHYEISLNNQAA